MLRVYIFDELVQRSMLQPSQFCKTKNEGYIMHDLIHDLAIFIAENQCLSVMDNEKTSISTNLLHASFVPSRDQVTLNFHVLGRARQLRTLIVPMSRHMQSSIYNLPNSETREVQFDERDFRNSYFWNVSAQLNYMEYEWSEPMIMFRDHVVDQKHTAMVKAFQCYNSSRYEISESMIQMFQQLRVLGLSYTGLEKLPNLIGELKHLRYLSLKETSITCLPESLCKLYNLQVLDLDRCENLCKLPRGMKNLTELRHLTLPILHDSHLCMPRGMGNLTNLQTLSAFYVGGDVYHCGIDELTGLLNLKGELKIYGLDRVLQQNFPDLSTMRSVKKMILHWNNGSLVKCNYGDTEDDQSQYINATSVLNGLEPPKSIEELVVKVFDGSRLPSWMGNCSYLNLSSMRLDFCNDSCTELPPLGRLPFLKYLSVQGMNALRRIGPEFCGCTSRVAKCFPRLETLEFSEMLSWEEWDCNFHENSFRSLSELTIGSCSRLLKFPPGLSPSISTLELQDCDSLDSIPMLPSLTSLRLWGSCPFYLWSRSLCLPNLNHLLISFYQLHILEFFANLPMLNIVRLENCKIEEVIGLQHLKSLKIMELCGCPDLKLTQDILQQSNFCVMFAP
ncbi:NBS-LRR-like resistance protein [Rhynchospora pubera]|uniref:NBS-LRR-like resistance protein n=1 Tax=Rhynchospora pubera TaxID=906938 RepID=A0AAV8E8W7_9POAL|nr:NBS-LRR-like resistance protein [Rhynchospora pubera]